MKSAQVRALALACLLMPLSVLAQWQWIDSNGKKVFSDTPPPPGVAEKDILRRNGASQDRRAAPTAAASPAAPLSLDTTAPGAAPATAATPPQSGASNARSAPAGVDKELEAKIRKAEEAEKAKRTAEEQKLKAARAENCTRARQSRATLDSGVRVARLNAQGEREVIDDAARASEQQRLDRIIESDCR
ncbi:MAG: DUF4124 domain-containing protein [Comamonadaceae bacterium]|nr:MAG: DUF4124 domain-containing protein [Comamonadaceae bacterium]